MPNLRPGFLLLLSCWIAAAAPSLIFEPNRGQTDAPVRYLARTGVGTVFFTDDAVVFDRRSKGSDAGSDAVLRFELDGADSTAPWRPEGPGSATTSYFIGRDESRWVRGVPQYGRLVRRGVYPGIDMAWYGTAGRLEYDFLLAPGADPARIRMRIEGAHRVFTDADGGLTIETAAGAVRQHRPEIYQTLPDGRRAAVTGRFRVSHGVIGFALDRYDPKLPLAIDPVLDSSTYLGGNADDRLVYAAPTVSAGSTSSIDFPGASFARRKGNDIVVRTGPTVYVIGGSGNDEVTAVSYSIGGGIAVVGYTDSQDLPTNISLSNYRQPLTPWQPNYAGGATDGFFLYIGPTYSTPTVFLSYIGTGGDDRVTAITSSYYGYSLVGTTTGQGLPTSTYNYPAMQPAPAGGIDGFLMVVGNITFSPTIYFSTYLGGSGDDRPLAIASSNSILYITGETSSPDFPLPNALSSARSGPTDAFLISMSFVTGPALQPTAGTFIGGSGADRGTALAFQNGDLVVAGVTASPDLPVSHALQPGYGGGASDIFLARFSPDLSQMLSLTYYGGSGAEEPTAMAGDGSLYVGGWTSSTDFPVQNAVQSTYGGGPDDGFLLHFDLDESLYAATYFGGSASDRILGLAAFGNFSVWLAGQTTSHDLPLANPTQSALDGPSDGFMASISAPLLGSNHPIGAKGLRGGASVTVGLLNGSVDAPATISTSDPSSILLAPDLSSAAQPSVTIASPGAGATYRTYYVECQAESGGADLTLSAPGYPNRVVHADCYPVRVNVSISNTSNFANVQGVFTTSPWLKAGMITASLLAVNPSSANDYGYVYPAASASPLTLQIQNSNPAAATVDSSVTLNSQSVGSFQFQPLAPGAVQLSFTAPGFRIANTVTVNVVSPLNQVAMTIPGGFQAQAGLDSGGAPRGTVATVTSSDPGRLLLSTDPKQPGSGSLTVALDTQSLYLQALATSGDVSFTVSVPGFDPVTGTVHLAQPVVYCSGCGSLSLGIAESKPLSYSVGVAGPANFTSYVLNPGAPVTLTPTSSDNTIASIAPASSVLKPGTYSSFGGFTVTGVAAGSATLTSAVDSGLTLDAAATSVPVTVTKKPLALADLDVGKDLAASASVFRPAAATGAVTVSIADPTLAVLSTDNRGAGQQQITFSGTSFYVQGLAASGHTTITATVAGYGSVTANVTLGPAGFGWNADSVSTILYNQPSSASVYVYALDGTTLLPVAAETPRFGTAPAVQLTPSDPTIVSAAASTTMQPNGSGVTVTLTANAVGSATIGITQPPGFATPPIRQQLKIQVQEPSLQVTSSNIGKDTQISFSVYVPSGASGTVTVTSSDPSRLVLSTDPGATGAASVTFPASGNHPLYAQALDSQGTVTVTASMPGFHDGIGYWTLTATGIGFVPGYTQPSTSFSTTTQSPNTALPLGFYLVDAITGQQQYGSITGMRPGVAAPQVTVTSSNTAVGQIQGSPVQVAFGSQRGVTFVPIAPGDTDLTITEPAGYVAPANMTKLSAHVTLPSFSVQSYVMARDTMIASTVSLGNGVQSSGSSLSVTITSGDPTKVLLSHTPDTPPAGSITLILAADSYSTGQFYIHALDRAGAVPLTVSAAGYANATGTITLSDLVFGFAGASNNGSPLRSVIQSGPQSYQIVFGPLAPSSSGYTPQASIRPGAANIALNVRTSDPTTLAVDNPQVGVPPGSVSAKVTARPVAPGPAILSLDVPAGYLISTTAGNLPVSVEGARLNIGTNISLGRDLQQNISISSEVAFAQPVTITVTSSDPSRLLISTDSKTPGQPSVTVTAQGYPVPSVWLQALSDNGTVNVTAAADGYQPAVLPVTLLSSAPVFNVFSQGTQTLYTNSQPQTVNVIWSALDSSQRPVSNFSTIVRPGANLTATVASSDKTVLTTDVSTLTFDVNTNPAVKVTPVGSGTAVLSLTAPPGVPAASSGAQILYTVMEPDLYVPNVNIGMNFQAPLQVRLASRIPAPATDVTVTISSDFGISLSNGGPLVSYPNTIQVVIPAGQHLSKPFSVQGTALTTGTLQVSAPGLMSAYPTVHVLAPTFVFQQASSTQSVAVTSGSTTNLTIVPAVLPLGTPPAPGMAVGAVALPVSLGVSVGTASVVSAPSAITLNPGDQQATLTVRGLAPGSSYVALLPSSVYGIPNAQSTVNLAVSAAH